MRTDPSLQAQASSWLVCVRVPLGCRATLKM
jgi:hypothetical protein